MSQVTIFICVYYFCFVNLKSVFTHIIRVIPLYNIFQSHVSNPRHTANHIPSSHLFAQVSMKYYAQLLNHHLQKLRLEIGKPNVITVYVSHWLNSSQVTATILRIRMYRLIISIQVDLMNKFIQGKFLRNKIIYKIDPRLFNVPSILLKL